MYLTFSWDDGHPSDLRIAEVLGKYDLHGTFYVLRRNREGLPVLSDGSLRELAKQFEIGAHTHSHCYLAQATKEEAKFEICHGKTELEDLLGRRMLGFCYPGGKFSSEHVRMVQDAGFEYARTTVNCCTRSPQDLYRMPVTLQFFPHQRSVYARNFVRRGQYASRVGAAIIVMSRSNLASRLEALVNMALERKTQQVLHFWGHSYEVVEGGLLTELDKFCRYLSTIRELKSVTNSELSKMWMVDTKRKRADLHP